MSQRSMIVLSLILSGGCGRETPPSKPAAPSPVLLTIHRPEGTSRIFQADSDVPPSVFPFEGARGNVRLTLEVDSTESADKPKTPMINDILFHAEGAGRISVGFQQPTSGHPHGRVIVRCESTGEKSEAIFEPDLWLSHPSALVTFEAVPGELANPVIEGREINLGRFVARNMPRDVRLTLKVLFSSEPVTPRVKASPRSPR